jgi:hypothetical protein
MNQAPYPDFGSEIYTKTHPLCKPLIWHQLKSASYRDYRAKHALILRLLIDLNHIYGGEDCDLLPLLISHSTSKSATPLHPEFGFSHTHCLLQGVSELFLSDSWVT